MTQQKAEEPSCPKVHLALGATVMQEMRPRNLSSTEHFTQPRFWHYLFYMARSRYDWLDSLAVATTQPRLVRVNRQCRYPICDHFLMWFPEQSDHRSIDRLQGTTAITLTLQSCVGRGRVEWGFGKKQMSISLSQPGKVMMKTSI